MRDHLLPPAYVVRREGTVFHRCLSVHRGGVQPADSVGEGGSVVSPAGGEGVGQVQPVGGVRSSRGGGWVRSRWGGSGPAGGGGQPR